MRSRLMLTTGDPAGIGPEITVKALANPDIFQHCIPVVIGDACCLLKALQVTGSTLRLRCIASPEEALGEPGTLELIDMQLLTPSTMAEGVVSRECGDASFRYVVEAIRLSMAGQAAGVVTGPICKESIALAGHRFSGHTEIFAHYTNAGHYAMLLASGSLRVIHCTTHVSMRRACDLITTDRVLEVIRLGHAAMQDIGIAQPRIAVAGLNAHASENGLFGTEEKEQIIPAIHLARDMGMNVDGPLPPDTVFVKALGGQYDLVVAMYHDQGHIPVKLAGFRMDADGRNFSSVSGINITVGLPIIRTSVDHGTAFDRAWTNTANAQSMEDAILLAAAMSTNADKRRACHEDCYSC